MTIAIPLLIMPRCGFNRQCSPSPPDSCHLGVGGRFSGPSARSPLQIPGLLFRYKYINMA